MTATTDQPSSLARTGFSSRLGFVLAAAGSAVGLGNIWSFPTQVAENGGAAFVLVYLGLSLLLAYPALVAELMIGRYSQSNPITALEQLPDNHSWRPVTRITGIIAVLVICLIFSFYSVVGGWLAGFAMAPVFEAAGFSDLSKWMMAFSTERNLLLAILFVGATLAVVNGGVKNGIERWSARLMPLLVLLLIGMIFTVMPQEGATEGLKHYLVPDFSQINTDLMLNAMGQAFFSMSLGVCAMMIYGSYLRRDTNLPGVALQVCLLDTGIAFLAGLLIIPALYVALSNGVSIYENGQLVNSDTLVFEVLPDLFTRMGTEGIVMSLSFFALMTIAALTSSISMLEVPVSCLAERSGFSRAKAGLTVCAGVLLVTLLLIIYFDPLFNATVTFTTRYAQPINSLLFCLYAGWLISRHRKLQEISRGWSKAESSLFWKIWPWYIRIVCPVMIGVIIFQSI
ncbi:sodium-dependent transporter [Sansalvadorimonas sp. 2012CJ34-2]|uniref:Sodium-dependent transporter n=1 Tax=Parendozoicomonas callyspongiae TaxID=2942213 RepID=A0ABT0PCV6_9GAMM|nr:sodium-dependent transporter [Sansalvadorimonas sp. 2012CJ34-2]MCL6269138.1 sodium-dependent transporter [Sansalvadorimonas sp. 2012CJ34-2]